MTQKKRPAKERQLANRLYWGNLMGASPPIQEIASAARDELERGEAEDLVHLRIRSRCESEGLAGPRSLLPSLSRKLLRTSLRKLVGALVDLMVDRTKSRKVGDLMRTISDKLGWDKWLEDYIYTFAETGKASPIFESFAGTVMRQDVGEGEEKTAIVWLMATPASDIPALIEMFHNECDSAFPGETFSKKHRSAEEGAEYFMRGRGAETFSQIAHANIQERYPDMLASDDDTEFYLYEEFVKRETERVKKLSARAGERRDRIIAQLSPSEE